VAFISAAAKGKKGKVKGQGYKVSAPVIDGDEKGYTKYTIFVGESSPTIRVKMILTDLLVPYPAEISQSDNQFVRFVDSHYFYSPYSTTTQKLVVKLASSTVPRSEGQHPHLWPVQRDRALQRISAHCALLEQQTFQQADYHGD
jgi:hypothetical protein